MASVNKAIIVGNCAADAEKRTFPDGGSVTNVKVATNMTWNDSKTGEKKEEVEYHSVVFRGKLADVASEYLKKGSQVYVEGRIRTRRYKDKQGIERFFTEIIAERMQMLGSRKHDDVREEGTAAARAAQAKERAATQREAGEDDEPF